MRNIKVESCRKCPFREISSGTFIPTRIHCQMMNYDKKDWRKPDYIIQDDIHDNNKIDKKCPLKKESIILELIEK